MTRCRTASSSGSPPRRARDLWVVATRREYGGQGLGELDYVLVWGHAAHSTLDDVRNERSSTGDQQRERFLLPVIRGERHMFFAVTEPSGGSDAAGIRTLAEHGDGGSSINGRQQWIGSGGPQPFGIGFAVTDEQRRAKGGITAFILENDTPGFHNVRVLPAGVACTRELRSEECYVPDDNVLGEVCGAFRPAQRTLSNPGGARRGRPRGHARPRRPSHLPDRRRPRPPLGVAADEVASGTVGASRDHLAIQLHCVLAISTELPMARLGYDVRRFCISGGADGVQQVLVALELLGRE